MELDFFDKYCWYRIFRPFIANLHSFKGLRSKTTPCSRLSMAKLYWPCWRHMTLKTIPCSAAHNLVWAKISDLKGLLIVESVLSLSSWFTGTPLKNLETNNSNTISLQDQKPQLAEGIQLAIYKRGRAGTRADREQIWQVARAGLERGTAGLRVREKLES